MRLLLLVLLFLGSSGVVAQDSTSVLFLGNSYTASNNLPQIVADLSAEVGKPIIFDSNTPGGSTLDDHVDDPSSMSKIEERNWDYIVLQEQSQVPTITYYKNNLMLPAVADMQDSIDKYAPCAKVVLFMTWGRQNGGQQCGPNGNYCSPDFNDFSHMQDSLEGAYLEAAASIDAMIAPVGIAWKKVIEDTSIVLHSSDESHPNPKGSYVAACNFFELIHDTSSVGNPFKNGLNSNLANYLQQRSHAAVTDPSASWNLNASPCSSATALRNSRRGFKKTLRLYPNPAKKRVNIAFDGKYENLQVRAISSHGKTFQLSIDEGRINIGHLDSGIYLLTFRTAEGRTITQRILVE